MDRSSAWPARRLPLVLALLSVFALVVTVVPLAGPANADHLTQFPGEDGTIVEHSDDGLVPTYRFRGRDRLDTAALIATDPDPEVRGTPAAENADQEAYFLDAETVLLARADLFPDSLSGNYLAGVADGPILLTASDALSDVSREALSEIGPENVVVLGGEAAISPAVVSELEAEGYQVERFGGADRFATAIDIANAGGEVNELNGLRTAIVASGVNFPDAVVSGGLAFQAGFPLLLSTPAELEPQTAQALEDLQIEQVIIPGGPVALSEEVAAEIETITGNDVIRRSGDDRVETAIDIARFAVEQLDFTLEHVNVARGDLFPDSLTIGPHAGAESSVLLLAANNVTLDGDGDAVASYLDEEAGCALGFIHLAGGPQALTPEVEQEVREAATREGENCQVDLTPKSATNRVNEPHTVTATVTDNGEQVPDETTTVTFVVVPETGTAGPPGSASVDTDEDGTAEFQFNSQSPGRFLIQACIEFPDDRQACDTASKTYEGPVETSTASPSPSPNPSPSSSASTSPSPEPQPSGTQNPDGPQPAEPAPGFDSPIGSDGQVNLDYGVVITCGAGAEAQFTYTDASGSEDVPATSVLCGSGGNPSRANDVVSVRFPDGTLHGNNAARQDGTLTYTQSANAAARVQAADGMQAVSPDDVTVTCCGILIG